MLQSSAKVENLVVGAGFSGATIAREIAQELGEKVLIIDKKSHIAGNSYDFYDENGICIHKYGSHIFHTRSEKVWKFIKQFASFNTYTHKVLALIDGVETHIPFNLKTIHDIFPKSLAQKLEEKLLAKFEYGAKVPILEFKKQADKDLDFLSNYIYEKVFLGYTQKQWGLKPDEIDSSVSARVPVSISKDDRYFYDKYQGIPLEGYSTLIENMLNHENIEVLLNTQYEDIEGDFKRIFYTGSIDEYFNYKFGQLPYRSVNFEFQTFNREFYQKGAVVNYPNDYDFTRIHEFKHYLNDESEATVIAKEYSEAFELGINERYYPIINPENTMLYEKYIDEAKKIENLYFLGRLGDYKYYDMDKAIERALDLFEAICQK